MALSVRFPPLILLVVLHASSAPPRPLLSASVCFIFHWASACESDLLSGGRYSRREFASFFLAIVILSARSRVRSFTGGLISM
jgi:hypothetical protein